MVGVVVFCFFFFKRKTAYELRISDWSSDVCSSDPRPRHRGGLREADLVLQQEHAAAVALHAAEVVGVEARRGDHQKVGALQQQTLGPAEQAGDRAGRKGTV